MEASQSRKRLIWVDVAKGFSIILVVMMHATLGVSALAPGFNWMEVVVDAAQPFRIPTFFLLAGLMFSGKAERPWREILDRKVLHFVYFYALWLTLQFAVKAPLMARNAGWQNAFEAYALAFIEPFGTLWFIYLLPIFFVITTAVRKAPALMVLVILAMLEIAPIDTGWLVVDEFCNRFVYFYAGYAFARFVYKFAGEAYHGKRLACALVIAFLLADIIAVEMGFAKLPGVSLMLGLAGAGAMIACAVLLTSSKKQSWASYCGKNSLIIYLAFFLPMAAAREVLHALDIVSDNGTVSLIVMVTAVIVPLLLHCLTQKWQVGLFLFERPRWAHLKNA